MKLKNGIVAFLTVLLATDCLARAIFEEIRPLVARNRFRSKSDRALSLSFKNVEEETHNPSGGHEEVKPVAEKILVREDIHQSQGSESDHHPGYPNTVPTVSEDNTSSHPEQHVNQEIKPITDKNLELDHSGHQSQGSESDQAHRFDSNTVETVSESNLSNHPAEELKSSKVLVDQIEDPNHSSSNANLETHNIKPDSQTNPIQSEANEKSESTQNSSPVQPEPSLNQVDNHDTHHEHERANDEHVVKEVNQTIQFNDKPSFPTYLIEYYEILAKAASLSPVKSEDNAKDEIKLTENDKPIQDLHPEKEHKVNVDSSSIVPSPLESETVLGPKMQETHQQQSETEVLKPKEDEIAILETHPEKVAQEANSDHKINEYIKYLVPPAEEIKGTNDDPNSENFIKVVEEVIERVPEQHFDPIETQLQEVKPAEDQTRQSEISVDQVKVQETPISELDHVINVENMEAFEPVIKLEEQNNLDEKPKEQINSAVAVHNNEISADKPCSAQLTEETNHRMSELFEVKIYVNKKLIRLGV